MTLDVGSNILNNHSAFPTNDSIFINGNLARVLLASHKIKANNTRLAEGLRWCDSFSKIQLPITTAKGNDGGYWNTGYNEVYIADTGTAITALALCHSLATETSRKQIYESALHKFKLFVTEGCVKAPTNPNVGTELCPPANATGWVLPASKFADTAGALGDGWYKDELNYFPYTISTATTGSCGFVEYDNIRSDPDLKAISLNAIQWLLRSRDSEGRIPYIITPAQKTHGLYQATSYSTESFVIVDLRYGLDKMGDGTVHESLSTALNKTVHWLVANQSADGSWGYWQPDLTKNLNKSMLGFSPREDALRSPRALSLLQWYYERVDAEPKVANSIQQYVNFLLDPSHHDGYGIGSLALPTGFIGLAIADLIQPWVSFRN